MIKSTMASLAFASVLALGMAASSAAQAQAYTINTGDGWLDGRMGEVDSYGRRHRDSFVTEVVSLGAPRPLVVELLDSRGWSPGDIYMACTIANVLGIACGGVVERYEANRGQGWGRLAQDMGIKPGSPEFHALKRGTVSTYDRWGYPIAIDSPTRVDWSDRPRGRGKAGQSRESGSEASGNRGRGNQGSRRDHGNQGNQGSQGNQGNQGRGRGNRGD